MLHLLNGFGLWAGGLCGKIGTMDAPVLWRLTRRGGYDPPALLWQAAEGGRGNLACGRVGMVSPCGATYFAHVGKVGKTPPGDGVSKNTPCFYAASPGPPFIYGGATKGRVISIRRGQKTGYRTSRRPLPLRVG